MGRLFYAQKTLVVCLGDFGTRITNEKNTLLCRVFVRFVRAIVHFVHIVCYLMRWMKRR